MLSSLAAQNNYEHIGKIFQAGAVPALVSVVSTGSAKAQQAAASALYSISHGSSEHQQAMMAAGAATPLVKLTKGGSAKVQEEAAAAIASIDADVSHQKALIKAGCIGPLVAMLSRGSAAAQAFASQALGNAASYDKEIGQNAIVKAGAVPHLIKLLSEGKAQTHAAGALAKLAMHNPAVQSAIAAAGGIAPLLSLLNGRDTNAQVQAAFALSEMARDNESTQRMVAKAGGIGPLLALLASRSGAAQSKGMAALAQLARGNVDNQDAIARMGGVKPLVQLLDDMKGHEPDVQAHAAFALMEISRSNPANQQLVVNHGGIASLASLMNNDRMHSEVKAEVAGALWSLSEACDIKRSIAKVGTVPPLVMLLGMGHTRAREHAAHALSSLALDNEPNQVQVTQLLIDLLTNGAEEAQERAAKALWALVADNPSAHEAIAKAGAPPKLVQLLVSGISQAKDYALWSLSLSISADNQGIVAESGGIDPLIEQLSDPRTTIREQAAAALAKLAVGNEETRPAITSAGGVKPLIKLLDTTDANTSETILQVGRITARTLLQTSPYPLLLALAPLASHLTLPSSPPDLLLSRPSHLHDPLLPPDHLPSIPIPPIPPSPRPECRGRPRQPRDRARSARRDRRRGWDTTSGVAARGSGA